jgi:L-amino acid N-acyltransferase
MLTIRRATLADLRAITEIYNEAILTTSATFDTEPKSVADRQTWFYAHGSRYPILVAVLDGRVTGWASLSKWSDRCAYADTAEISLYVSGPCQGQGLGKKLMAAIIQAGQAAGLHTIVARIATDNEASIHLCQAAGFESVGVMREVGRKFGRLLDIYLMQKIYE